MSFIERLFILCSLFRGTTIGRSTVLHVHVLGYFTCMHACMPFSQCSFNILVFFSTSVESLLQPRMMIVSG